MIELLLPCILLGLGKREFSLVCLFLYAQEELKARSTPYKLPLSTIQDLTNLNKGVVVETLQKLVDKNIITTTSIKDISDTCPFYISTNGSIYEFNDNWREWRILPGTSGANWLLRLKASSLEELINKLPKIDTLTEVEKKVEGLSSPDIVKLFAKMFREYYKRSYNINWIVDTAKMKKVLQNFILAGREASEVANFLKWCFEKKASSTILNTGLVLYLINEYFAGNEKVPLKGRYIDEDGRVRIENQTT